MFTGRGLIKRGPMPPVEPSLVVTSTIELDPFGGDTTRSSNQAFQPKRFTTYERETTNWDEAGARNYHAWWSRFAQPDPYDGSYNLTDPQSFNRYAYVQNDPVNFTDPTGLMACGAEFSYSECGGGGGFWGGAGGFGGHVAQYNREYGGLPPNIVSGLAGHNQRLQNTLDALAATAAYRRGGANDPTFQAIMARNKTLFLVATLSRGQQNALALISLIFGQAIGDQFRFDVVAQLTGLADYINGTPDYDPNTRTFSVNFKPEVEKFLASSPYFAGPGLALLHRDVGVWDYRSYSDMTGGLSMQVVLGRDISRSYADFDRDNPYQDVARFFRHNVPIIFRRLGRIFK
jgi:RHS repeat-associated protein